MIYRFISNSRGGKVDWQPFYQQDFIETVDDKPNFWSSCVSHSSAKFIKRWPLSHKARIWEMAVHWSRIYEIERSNESEAKRTEKKGRGNKPNEATALLEEEIDIFFEKKVLGTSSWQSLLNTVWLNNILPKSSVQGQQNDCNWLKVQAMGVNKLNNILKY